ncbi:MAG: virB8 family protein [Blastomonas fulva]|uniref:virB8 family protein n=1 Tax=Blastomonas fulva TaxID=1550728 RepID=UPI0040348401
MKQDTKAEREAYYREAGTWAHDQQQSLRSSRRIAWIVASIATGVAMLLALALVLLTPLKTVEPYTLLVDRQTGFVQAVDPLEPQRISGDAALTQSFLVQYVIARESFDIDSVQSSYRKVSLWSADSARARYVAMMQATNPESPLTRYPRSTVIDTVVKSVSPMTNGKAMVRFETRRSDRGSSPRVTGSWVALVSYRFAGEPLRVEDRYLNPLGFQVVRYQRDPEALPPPVPVLNQPAASTPPSTTRSSVPPVMQRRLSDRAMP